VLLKKALKANFKTKKRGYPLSEYPLLVILKCN